MGNPEVDSETIRSRNQPPHTSTEETIHIPQIAFIDATSWAIRGPFFSHSGLHAYHQMPQVSCPVVDTSQVQDRQRLDKVLAHAISPEGVKDVGALLSELTALGCQVSMPAKLPRPATLVGIE